MIIILLCAIVQNKEKKRIAEASLIKEHSLNLNEQKQQSHESLLL